MYREHKREHYKCVGSTFTVWDLKGALLLHGGNITV